MATPPTATVIIPVYDDAARLDSCLASVGPQAQQVGAEILVVDNGSRDDPGAVVDRYAAARMLHEPTPGSYAARNTALKEAEADVLAFTDADCVPAPDWLANGLAALARPGVVRVAGPIELVTQRPGKASAVEEWELAHTFRQERYVREFGWAATANLFVRREVFDAVGPFNAQVRSGGDKEWGSRATDAGVALDFDPEVVVRHPTRRTLRELRTKHRRIVTGDAVLRAQGAFDARRVPLWRQLLVPPVKDIRRGWDVVGLTSPGGRARFAATTMAMRYVRTYDELVVRRQQRRQAEAA